MKILNVKVDWFLGYANRPRLELTVDKKELDEAYKAMRYKKHVDSSGCTLYWGMCNDMVDFYASLSGNKAGFGGRSFTLNMEDGTVETIIGPWSSRPDNMNGFFSHSVDATINGLYAAHISLSLAKEAAKMAGCHLVQLGLSYYPSTVADTIKKPEVVGSTN